MTDDALLRNLRVGWDIEITMGDETISGRVIEVDDDQFRVAISPSESRAYPIPWPEGTVRVVSSDEELDIETVGQVEGHYEPALDELEDDPDAVRVEPILGTPEAVEVDPMRQAGQAAEREVRFPLAQQREKIARQRREATKIATIHLPMDLGDFAAVLFKIAEVFPDARLADGSDLDGASVDVVIYKKDKETGHD